MARQPRTTSTTSPGTRVAKRRLATVKKLPRPAASGSKTTPMRKSRRKFNFYHHKTQVLCNTVKFLR
jgi:hypothetical protein